MKALSISDIQNELGCSPNHARKIVLTEIKHINISTGTKPTYRVSRKDFDAWKESRTADPQGHLERFAQLYTR